jgi:hypothetical protein
MIRILSLGGGVQSYCIARMSFDGDLPPLNHMIFADTGAEWPETYEAVAEIEAACHNRAIGFHRVENHYARSTGNLLADLMGEGATAKWAAPPLFIEDGFTQRQCTGDYKKDPIEKRVREIVGLRPRSRGPKEVVAEQWLGISADEKQRMKASVRRWCRFWHPLIEGPRLMWRSDCIAWLKAKGYRVPVKSACFFCPYQSDRRWLNLKLQHPQLFAQAVALDKHTRAASQFKGKPYYHRSCKSLDQAVAEIEELMSRQAELPGLDQDGFEDECHGVCGV